MGQDANSGLSPDRPVLTLARAQEILIQTLPQQDVEVRIAPGRYFAQQVVWTYSSPDHKTYFVPMEGQSERPVFDGCTKLDPNPATDCPLGPQGAESGWLIFQSKTGKPTNLSFDHLEVTHYINGLRLLGDKQTAAGSNGFNRVHDCFFHDIGDGWAANLYGGAMGFGAIRTENSDDNEFSNNRFENIVDGYGLDAHMHAFYVAGGTDRNRIENNSFKKVSGDVVRWRNGCLDNRVTGNTFSGAGKYAAVSDWNDTGECESWGTVVEGNRVDGNFACDGMLPVWRTSGNGGGCAAPGGRMRVILNDNCTVAGSPFCTGTYAACR